MPHDPYKALYVHIPFCVSRCAYCDFATRATSADAPEVAAYVEDLVMQMRRKGKGGELADIETVYFGGGTPSHLGTRYLTQLLYTLGLSMHLTPDVECTVECNPESLDVNLVRDMWALGVNRLSIGVQSFDDGLLRVLGRAHDSDDARRAVCAAQDRFENVSIDLMCGLPGQTEEMLRASLREAIDLGVKHISIYPLTIEDHTPFAKMVARGQMEEPDEDTEATHMQIAADVLEKAGFERYEVASYARPGYESRHNTAYWTGVPYLGLGASATTMTQNAERRMRMQDGQVTDDLNANQMAAEDLMLGMRMSRGVGVDQVERAAALLPDALAVFAELESLGLVKREDARFKPTIAGWLCGNELYGRIFDLAP